MLVFTLIVAGTVFKEVFHEYAFPALPEGLLTLMGVSSAVYLGNDLTRTVTENDLKNKFKEIDEYLAQTEGKQLSTLPDDKKKELRDLIDAYLL